VINRSGGPEVLELEERPTPEPGAGQLLVDAGAAGVNYRDVYEREGAHGPPPPLIAGIEGAGKVAAVGDGVSGFSAGDRVGWITTPGSYAEQVLVDAGRAIPTPDGISDELAAAALLQGITAHYLVTSTYPVQAGDSVLVHAAAGGVGLLLVQMVKRLGGRVIGTTSTEEKAALVRAAGADEVVGYEGFGERARAFSGGGGVAVVYDGVGQATFVESLAAIRRRGTMVVFGASSGQVVGVAAAQLMFGGSVYLTSPSIMDYTATRDELLWRAEEVYGQISGGKLDVRIGGRYPLGDARRAHEDLQARRSTGKLVILTRS